MPDIEPRTGEWDAQEIKPPREVNPDRDKTVFDSETGEWKTITEAKQQAEERAENQYLHRASRFDLPPTEKPLPPSHLSDQNASVFDSERGEWITVEESRRQMVLNTVQTAEDDTDYVYSEDATGVIEEDVGKQVRGLNDEEVGELVRVDSEKIHIKPVFRKEVIFWGRAAVQVTDDYVKVSAEFNR
ncbi:hypothetical protein [Natrinema salinisoli]|uniref:hypothetical protein n=1 Tax=Natrinema salinisoli TaxID=2878535 RepID=UPI001CF0A686|nr:hypothetical protein [Natrinema salinisoli]